MAETKFDKVTLCPRCELSLCNGRCFMCGWTLMQEMAAALPLASAPKCPKCGSVKLEFHSSNVYFAYVECHNDLCDYDLATNSLADFAQFFTPHAVKENS